MSLSRGRFAKLKLKTHKSFEALHGTIQSKSQENVAGPSRLASRQDINEEVHSSRGFGLKRSFKSLRDRAEDPGAGSASGPLRRLAKKLSRPDLRVSAKEHAKAKGISAASAPIPASALVPLQESALPKEEEHMAKPPALSQEKDSETEENAEFANKRYGTHFTGDPLELWKNPKGKDKAISASGETQLLQLPRISALKNGTKGVNKAERRAYFYPTVSVIAEPSEDGAEHDIQEVLVRDIKYSLSLEGKDSAPSRQTSKSTILQASSERLPSKNRPLPVTATIESKGQQFLCLPLTGKEDRIDTPIHSPKSSQLAVNSPSAPIPKQNVGDPSRKVPCPHEHCTHCLTDLAALSASFNFPSVPQADFTPHYVDQATSIAGLAASLPRATQEDEQPHPSLPSVQLKSVTSNATVSRVTRVMLPEDHRAGWEQKIAEGTVARPDWKTLPPLNQMRTYLGRKDLREDVEVAGRPELAPMEPIDDLPSVGSGGLEADTENLPAQPDVQAQSKKKTPKSWSKSWSKARSRAAVTFSSLRGRPTQGSPEQFEAQEVETPLVAAKKVEKPRRKLQGLAPDMAESDAFQPFIEEDLLKNIMAFDQPCPPVRRRGRGYRPSVLSFYGNTSQGPPVPQERLVELDAHQNDIHAAVTTGSQPSDQVPGTSKVDASTNT